MVKRAVAGLFLEAGSPCLSMKKLLKSLLTGSLAGAAIAITCSLLFTDLVDRLEHVTYYMRYRWHFSDKPDSTSAGSERPQYGINIIDIDDRSMQKMGLYWNWDRSYQATLIRKLSNRFPAAIVYDILFGTEEDSNQRRRLDNLLARSTAVNPAIALSDQVRSAIVSTIDYDDDFVAATREAGCVFHGICLCDEKDYPDFALSQVRHKMSLSWHDSLNPASAMTFAPQIRESIKNRKSIIDGIFPALARAARAIGHVDVVPNEDGVIREIPLLYRFGDHEPMYLPLSVRSVVSLFATPDSEITLVPGRYLDIGSPFKAFRAQNGEISFSWPNMSAAQVRAIMAAGDFILAPGRRGEAAISSRLVAHRDSADCISFEMNLPGLIPCELANVLLEADLGAARNLGEGDSMALVSQITIQRDSEDEWIVRAPFDAQEWYFSGLDLATLEMVGRGDLAAVKKGGRSLLFHDFSVWSVGKEIVSSIPCLRNGTLKSLCKIPWEEIKSIAPGGRMDFGEHVRMPLTPDNRHIITFFGPKAKPFPRISFYDLFSDRIQGSFEGQLFVVGSTAPALFDIKAVPHDRSYPAVEIHASLMNSLLTNKFVRRMAKWQDIMILLLAGVLTGSLCSLARPLFGAIFTAGGILFWFLLAMSVFNGSFLWIEIIRPIITMLLTFTAVMAYRYITEEKDRKFLQSTFRQYLSPELIDIMYNSRRLPILGGDEGVRTAYFTDIQGFSTFSEKLGSPTRLVELLNEYLGEMTDILLGHYGTLDKYEGDAIIAFFGAPMPMEDHARQACLTALDMQQRLGTLREKWAAEGDKWPKIVHEMRMRIGINSGLITTGNMGSQIRKNYTMMGDAVNLAARLESAAKQYGVYTMISQHTRDMAGDDFLARQIDKVAVVGKSEPVVVYELLGVRSQCAGKFDALLELYQEGLNYFYAYNWDAAIAKMEAAHELEPCREFAPEGMTPSKKIMEYCLMYRSNPPGPGWDGVMRLSSK